MAISIYRFAMHYMKTCLTPARWDSWALETGGKSFMMLEGRRITDLATLRRCEDHGREGRSAGVGTLPHPGTLSQGWTGMDGHQDPRR